MNQTSRRTTITRACFALIVSHALFSTAFAQSAATGAIEGRVLNADTGKYLEHARLTVEGTSLEAFTDAEGNFRLTNVPAGLVRIRTFYTGLPPQVDEVAVAVAAAAAPVRFDITLSAAAKKPDAATDTVIKLDKFVVQVSREMEGAAVAINEQRFAPNIRTVASTDEFGSVAEGNSAEFLKFMPGVTIDYTGGNARDISINGVPSNYVPITVAGFNVASAVSGQTNRAVQADMISINDLSRIEVAYSPTPDSQGSALAGSVNMVPRSAFERVRPLFKASVFLEMRDNARDFNKVPGPKRNATRLVHPGFDFSYVAPVNKRFGFTLSGGLSTNYSPQDQAQPTWRGASAATSTNFAATTPDRPYLSDYFVRDSPKVTTRHSAAASIDYKLTPHDRVTFGIQFSSFEPLIVLADANFQTNRVLAGDFTPFSTRGAAGQGSLQSNHNEVIRFNRTYMPTFVWRHDGPVWKAEAGIGFSQQTDYNRDSAKGFFRTVTMRRTNVTVAFDDISYLRPQTITVRDGKTGAPVDPFALSTYSIVSATTQAGKTYDLQQTAYGSVRRDFFTRVPFTLKAGFDLRRGVRDIRGDNTTYNYLGPDGKANSGDESPVPFFDPIFSQRVLPFGFPRLETPSNRKIWERFVANPAEFTVNENTAFRNKVARSRYSQETVSALYLRGDVSLFNRRLKLVGGLRAEQTNVKADGPLNDPTLNFQRDAAGQIVRTPNGKPALIVPNTPANALAISQLTFLDRGAHTNTEYRRYFPSLNASYNLRENLIVRAAYYKSIGRPNFIQYSGGITLPDTDALPSPSNRITVNNPFIKAWSARTINVRIERYFEGVGQFSVGAFHRHIKNFFANTIVSATPEFLALHDLDPAVYAPFDVATQGNLDTGVRMDGVDFNYKQALTFLPRWARGVQVFANGSAQQRHGDINGDFAGFIPRSANWGISLTRKKFNVRANWNYRGRQRNAVVTGAGIEPGTFNFQSKRLSLDVLGEYYFWKRVGFFFNLRNVSDTTQDTEISGPSTPSHAQLRQRIDYASLWTFGIKGDF